jgi:hypothetical protein
MSNEEAFEALAAYIAFEDHGDGYDDERREAAQAALLLLRKALHSAQNRAEMACDQEPCGNCPGCGRAEELGGDPMLDWRDP